MAKSKKYESDFEPVFSFYLSNDEKVKGKMVFGGIDTKYFKKGLAEKDIQWFGVSENKYYWAVNSKDVKYGPKRSLAENAQQVILDNGMSFAMAPQKSFVNLVKSLYFDHGIQCAQMQPVWGCMCTTDSYNKLPNINFNFVDGSGKTAYFDMPKESYMMI